MGWSLSLGSIAGVRVRIHLTFVLFLAWVALAYGHAGGSDAAVTGLAYILLLFACVLAHEFGHILTAQRFGIRTIDVILLPIGGMARMQRIPEEPGQELLVAVAGPCVNLAIAGVLIALTGPQALVAELASPGKVMHLLPQLAAANLILAVFNLVPAFPMDGGRVLRAALTYRMGHARATALATRVGHVLAVGLGTFGLLSGLPLLMLVAAFIYLGASAENNQVQMRNMAQGLSVADAMITRFSVLPLTATIGEAVGLLVHSTQHDIPLVDGVGKVSGLLTRDAILRALHDHGADYAVADAPLAAMPTVPERAGLELALREMEKDEVPAVAVLDGQGRLTGMLTLESLGQLVLLDRMRREG